MHRLPAVAAFALLAAVGLRGATAGDEPREQVFPWPVATFDVPASHGASLSIRLDARGTSRTVVVGPHASLVLEWTEPAPRPTPDPQATLEILPIPARAHA